jgi:hypothetical protein
VQSDPVVATDGSEFLVVWQEARTASPGFFAVLGTRVEAGANVLALPAFLVDGTPFNQLAPVAAALHGSHRLLVLSQGIRDAAAGVVVVRVDLAALPRLRAAGLRPGGPFEFRLDGTGGDRYRVEASEDLSSWTAIDESRLLLDSVTYVDPAATTLRRRFYRAVLLP